MIMKRLARRTPFEFRVVYDPMGQRVRARIPGLPIEGLGATKAGADKRLAAALKKFTERYPLTVLKLVEGRGKQVLSVDVGPKKISVRVTA